MKPSMFARYLEWRRRQRLRALDLDPPTHLQFWAWFAVMAVVIVAVNWILDQAGVAQLASYIVNGLVIVALGLIFPMRRTKDKVRTFLWKR